MKRKTKKLIVFVRRDLPFILGLILLLFPIGLVLTLMAGKPVTYEAVRGVTLVCLYLLVVGVPWVVLDVCSSIKTARQKVRLTGHD